MDKVNITEVFCEVLSGTVVLVFFWLIFHLAWALPLENVKQMADGSLSFGGVAAILVLCYLLGLIMDSIGLAIGELFLDKLMVSSEPNKDQIKKFLQTVPEHVLKYGDTQWAYYSTYRNLLILLVPVGLLGAIIAWQKSGTLAALGVILTALIIGWALCRSMKTLLSIHYRLYEIEYKQD